MSGGYDVVVVGARVAGAATAMLLARAGARVALVDRAAPGSDTVSTHALMRSGVLQLSRWGLVDALTAAGTPAIRRVLFHYRDADPVQVSIRPSPGVASLLAPRRTVLDPLLARAAAASGADLVGPVDVVGVTRTGDRVDGVRILGADGVQRSLRTRLVIGADGIRSTVAGAVDAGTRHRGRTASAVLYRYVDTGVGDAYEWAYGGQAAAGIIPTNDGLSCVFVSTTPDRMRARRRSGTDAAFESLLAEAAPQLVERVHAYRRVGRVHGWAGMPAVVRESAGSGWALVGDAGYFKDPITTHGMTDAMRDAELLARQVVAGLAGERGLDATLRSYERERDRLSIGLLAATEQIAAYDWDMSRIQRLLREVSSSMTEELECLEALPASPLIHRAGTPVPAR
jgi:2-polyprenyl-6-methoxyphenol hydroxylase-like FAD-dependent oxidoreductase